MKVNDLKAQMKTGAGCLILAKDTEKFLLIQRSEYVPVALTWSLPGGSVEAGESSEQAARREITEEIGINLSSYPFSLIYTNEVYLPRFKFYTYACVVPKEFNPVLNWESQSHIWCDMDSLPQPLHWGVEQLFKHDAAGKKLKNLFDKEKTR